MKITNKNNLPQALVDAVSRDYVYRDKRYSATSILKPTREIILQRRHNHEIEQDVSDMLWLILGNAVHQLIQNSNTSSGQFKEEKIEMPLGDYTLSGIIDLYDIDNEIVSDWKTASVYKYKSGDWDDYKKQLMIYAYMLHHHGFGVKKIQIVPMYKDYRKSEALKGDYPEMPIGKIEFNVTDRDFKEIEEYISNKFKEIKDCEELTDDELPMCSELERWATPTKYAVMKKGRKTAVKLFDTKEEAEIFLKDNGDSIELRKGTDKKCTEYCNCCHFCKYWKENYGKR